MERRGRIPVAKFRTQEGKTRSRSRVREPDYNEQDPEHDLFTLLEDNIALKEENKALKIQIDDQKKTQNEKNAENVKLREELESLKKRQNDFDEQIKDLTAKYTKANNERISLDKIHKAKVEKINSLELELETLKKQQHQQQQLSSGVVDSHNLKIKLLKVLPTLTNDEMESLIDVESTVGTPITSELIERLVDEYLALKNSMNSVELQLYEANEKISELLENQHHLEEDNEAIRTENTNLTKVAKLLTENMKESVETSKKMEMALIKLKQRNDELTAKARDLTDGQPSTCLSPTTEKENEEFNQIKEEVENQNRDHGERIVEMKTLLEAAIQNNTNDELKTLQVKLEILEEELRKTIARAELAENELEKYKSLQQPLVISSTSSSVAALLPPTTPPPPPPPPPMPTSLLYKLPVNLHATTITTNSNACHVVTFSDSIASHSLITEDGTGDVGGAGGGRSAGNRIINTVMQQVQPETATGLDALVREFKSGGVTLRRNRRKTRTNEALQEMFQVLELSQKQNRGSKICIDMNR